MKRSDKRDVPLSARQRELLKEAGGVIQHVAKVLASKHPGHPFDDFVTWCEDGAIAAAQDYREDDPSRATFVTFAWPRIWGSGENAAKRERRASSPAIEERMRRGREACAAHAEQQRDTGNLHLDTEEDDERRPRDALDAFAAAYIVGYSLGAPPASPETEAFLAEVEGAVATLKGRDESLVRRHAIEGSSFAEIAKTLPGEPSEATVKRSYHAAIGRLAKRLGKLD